MNLAIRAVHRREKPPARRHDGTQNANGSPETTGRRDVFLPEERRPESVPIYAESAVTPGTTVAGPCIVDVGDTTIYLPTGATCTRDELFNFTLTV